MGEEKTDFPKSSMDLLHQLFVQDNPVESRLQMFQVKPQ